MLAILTVTLGLAAVFGFFLGMYFFTCRVNLPEPFRWLGGALGGLFMAVIMAGITLVMLWPPLSIPFLLGGLAFFGIVTAVTLGRGRTGAVEKCPLQGGEEHAGVDTYGFDLDAGTRP